MNDETKDATTAATRNASTSSILVNASSRRTSARTHSAPMRASLALLTNQARTIDKGTPPCSSATMCAENADASTSHQEATGVRSSAANRIEFGGHSTETGLGGNVSARPSFPPK